MKLSRKWMIGTAWLTVLSVTLAACVLFSLREHVLHLGVFAGSNWNVPGDSVYEIVDSVIERFEQQHSGVKVVYESGIRRDDYSEWLAGRMIEGELPDVFMVLDEDFPLLADMGAVKNLNSMMRSLDPDLFYPAALDAGKKDSVQYALPYESNPQFMFVNLTLLEKEKVPVPDSDWTLEDLYYISKRVTKDLDGDSRPDQFGIYNYSWQNALEAYGKSPFLTDGSQGNLLDEQVQQAIEYSYRLNDLAQAEVIEQSDFDSGWVAFSPMTYAEYRTYKPYPWKVKKFSEFEWTVIPMPGTGGQSGGASADSLLMSISSQSEHPREAWDLMQMFTLDEQTQQMVYESSTGLSSLATLEPGTLQDEQLDLEVIDQVMKESSAIERFPGYDTMMTLLDSRIRSQYKEANDKDIFFIDLQIFIDQTLEKNKN